MSRELYDLCRKYKYFYNKHRDVKCWDQKYHDIDLSDAVAKTKIDLGLVEHEMQKELFNIFGINCGTIHMENEIADVPMDRFGRMQRPHIYRRTADVEFVNSERFIEVLLEYCRGYYDRGKHS